MKKSLLFCLGLLTSSLLITGCQPNSSLNETVSVDGIAIESANNVRNIKVGETLQLTAKVFPEAASQEVTWSTSDATIATISESGLVTAVKKGNVNLVATSKTHPSVTKTFTLIVEESAPVVVTPTRVSISSYNNVTSVKVAATLELSIRLDPENADTSVDWSTSDATIATVSNKGVVTGVKEGKVTIKVTSRLDSNISDQIEITVEKSDNPVVNKDWATMPFTSHADYYSVESDKNNPTPMKIKGVVTHVTPAKEGAVNYFIQNGVDGFYVYAQDATTFPVEVGKSYEVGGYKKYYQGLNEIVDVEYFVESTETFTYTENELTGLNPSDKAATSIYHASLIKGEATFVSGTPAAKAYTIYAKLNDVETQFRIDPSYMSAEEFAAIGTKVSSLVAGRSFTFKGYFVAFGYSASSTKTQIQLVNSSDIVLGEVSTEQLLDSAKEVLTIGTSLPVSKSSISLPTSVEGFDGLTVSWATSSESINVSTGAVTHGTENEVVTLTATLAIGEKTVTKEFKVTIFANDTTVYETVATLDCEDALPVSKYNMSASKDTYVAGNATLGGKVWLLDNALIGCDKNDVFDGTFSIRTQSSKADSRIEIKEDVECKAIEFDVAVYGSDDPAVVKIAYSTDSGATWNYSETQISVDHGTLETYRVKLPEGTNRVALVGNKGVSGNRLNYDNIKLLK